MNFKLINLVIVFLLVGILKAQDFDIQKFALGDLLDSPTSTQFAEEGNSVLWLHYTTTESGVIVDRLLKYENDEWIGEVFAPCSSCISDLKQGPDGTLYIAAKGEGVYMRKQGDWTKILELPAIGLDWLSNGNMVILNTDGAHYYNGDTIVEANNLHLPNIVNLNDCEVDLTDDLYIVLPSKLYMLTDTGWVQKTDLETPMSIEVDSENRLWVTDNFGDIGYYQEGVYAGGKYFNFGTNDLAIDQGDVLWYSSDKLVRNQSGAELEIDPELLIDDAVFIQTVYVDSKNDVWVTSNFNSGIARVDYLGDPSSTDDIASFSELEVYPNPAEESTYVRFSLVEDQDVALKVTNLSGQTLYEMTSFSIQGSHAIEIDTRSFSAGIYFVHLSLGRSSKTLKLVKK